MAETHIQIGDVSPRIQYTGDGVQTVFTYPFPIFSAADLEVHLDQAKQSTGFSVNGAGQSAGGDVTFDTAPESGVLVTLRRRLAIQRTSDFQESGEFRAKVINDELDYQTAALQQIADDQVRSLRQSATDTATIGPLPETESRAGTYLGFDADGDPIASDGPAGVAVSAFGATLVDDLDAAAARSTLGLGAAAVEGVAAGGSGNLLRADGDGSGLTGIAAGATEAEKANIILNAFRIAINSGLSVQNMVDGIVDEFGDEAGVDTTASTNETYEAAGDYYHNKTYSSDQCAGGTPSASSSYPGTSPSNAFDDDAGTGWVANAAGPGQWLEYQFAASKHMRRVGIQQDDSGDSHDTSIDVQRYDGGAWTTVATIAPVKDGTLQYFDLPASATDTRWRFEHNTGLSNYWNVDEAEMMELLPPADMTLISVASTALAQPETAFIVLWQEDIDTVTPNTDLKAYASRDGGTTWTQTTLVGEAALATGRILAGTADISGQSAGSSMKYKIETLNNKEQRLHGVGLQWS